jgi:transglycosylase-like protein with SLT domain
MAVDATPLVGANSVTGAIRKAAQATGTSFDYLLATARVESDLNPNLTMRSSTATGLFQFIEQTWLGTLKQAGPAFGYSHYADAISQTASGRYVVADPALRNEIMQLRKDPSANALMGGVFTQTNAAVLASRLGRTPSEGELYVGHFFGPYAGAKAIALAASNPTANAAEIFPAAAGANRSIFYDKQGNARSIAGATAELIRRYQAARAQAAPTTAVAAAPQPAASWPAVPSQAAPRPPAPIPTPRVHTVAGAQRTPVAFPLATAARLNVPAVSATTPPSALGYAPDNGAPAALRSPASPSPADTTPAPVRSDGPGGMFHSLFQTGERREAISPAISELWGAQDKQASAQPADAPAGQSSGGSPRSLFSDP